MARAKKYTVSDGKMTLVLTACEEGGYTATCPDIPGLTTEGDTIEECFAMARDAARALKATRSVPPSQRYRQRRDGQWTMVKSTRAKR